MMILLKIGERFSMKKNLLTYLFIAVAALGQVITTVRAEDAVIEISIKDHKFSNEKITVKANQPFKIRVRNEDPTSEEFESKSMIIEKFLGPKRTLTLNLGPLKPGTYEFFGDFHQDTAKGIVIAE